VFASQDREAERSDRKAAIEAGLLHVLNVPPEEMAPADSAEAFGVEAETAARSRRMRVWALGHSIRRKRRQARETVR
jgi:hypothetical protein